MNRLKALGISALLVAAMHAGQEGKGAAFIGAEVGYGMSFMHAIQNTQQQQEPSTSTTHYPLSALGLKAGHGHYFSQNLGLRGYASYHYTYSRQGSTDSSTNATTTTFWSNHQIALNVEAIWDFLQLDQVSLGAYAGLGIGYGSLSLSASMTNAEIGGQAAALDLSGFILPVNVGLEVGIGKHHRAGLNFRIPTIAISYKNLNTTQTQEATPELKERNLIMSLGYTYVF